MASEPTPQPAQPEKSAPQDRDVTPEPPADHAEPRSHHGSHGRRTITNIADGGSRVGMQVGVVYGQAHVIGHRVSTGSTGEQGDVTGDRVQSGSHHDADITNIATSGSQVGMQVGVIFGNAHTGQRTNPGQADSIADVRRQVAQAKQEVAAMKQERARRQQGT